MGQDLVIRRYEPRDKNAVWRVHERALRASPIPFLPHLDRHLRRIPGAFADGEFLVGTVGGEVVAVGGFRPKTSRIIEITDVRVDPDHQRSGHGRSLVWALESRAHERGYERSSLHTSAALEAAQDLYRGLDYRETGREQHPDANLKLVCFEKRL